MPADPLTIEAQHEILLDTHRRLVIRRVRPDDAGALAALYGRLSVEDRHRRFFCAYRPTAEWFEELAGVQPGRGARLVAEVVDGTTTLVAEAGYTVLPNGNGDLAIVVDRPWRGWLGPFLLARLTDVAADHGIPNLEADVLATNGPMLALLRRRGAVILEHDGWRTLRMRIGTGGRMATWDGSDGRPRLLVEAPGGRWTGEDAARAAGLAVVTCPGPGPRRRCPALAGHPCPLAAGADAVIVRSPPGDDRWAALVDAHRTQHPQAALLLEHIGAYTDRAAEAITRLAPDGRRAEPPV